MRINSKSLILCPFLTNEQISFAFRYQVQESRIDNGLSMNLRYLKKKKMVKAHCFKIWFYTKVFIYLILQKYH